MRPKIPPEDVQPLLRALEAGETTLEQAAQRYGCSPDNVRRKTGFKPPRKPSAARSAANLRRWKDPAYRERQIARIRARAARRAALRPPPPPKPAPPPPPPPKPRDPWANQPDYTPHGERQSDHPKRDQPLNAKMRRCLGGCDQMFMSTHAGNRICWHCAQRI
jgi:hypothetical protein